MTSAPSTGPAISTVGALRASGHVAKPLRTEIRDNLLAALREGRDPWPGLHGFEDTVIPQLERALIAGHDVVLLGEIRDHETAQIAIEAALTGHLVLSTLHTNDAPSAVTRLVEMGIEPFLVGSALDCVVAQRLARKLCEKCYEPYTPTETELIAARFPWTPGEPLPELFRPVGCVACSRTGYRGRIALHEVMTVTEDIERIKQMETDIHSVFIDWVKSRRGDLLTKPDDELFTGEFWSGVRGLELGLIDAVGDLHQTLATRFGPRVRTRVIEP